MPSKENVLVTGFPGQLASAIRDSVGSDSSWKFCSREELDITKQDVVSDLVGSGRFDTVVNAAAYTGVDLAERNAEDAMRVNGEGPRLLALACRNAGSRLVHVSTDFVFEGTACRPIAPESSVSPVSEYGRSKLVGEEHVRSILGDGALVVRTAWLYAAQGRNFVATMLRLMATRDRIEVVADQVGTPTWAPTLAGAIRQFVQRKTSGVHHVTDSGVASWYDFAIAVRDIGLDLGLLNAPCSVVPISTAEYPTPAARPAYSVLDTSSTRKTLGMDLPHWRGSLEKCLAEVRANSKDSLREGGD